MDSTSQHFHKISKNPHPIPKNPKDYPEEWTTTYYKTYPRLPKIKLFDEEPPTADFFNVVQGKKSNRIFLPKILNISELSYLLKYSFGFTSSENTGGERRRVYPSAGARYPLEVYLLNFCGNDALKPGVYHYDIRDHQLDVLWEKSFTSEEIGQLFNYTWVENSSICIIMTSIFSRNQQKYGERGYRYILLEAGHIGQNIYLVSEALDLKCCAMGGTQDKRLEELLDVDGISESIVYSIVVGK